MKRIYSILLILLSTILFSACTVESDNWSDTKDETSIEDSQNITVFMDWEEQKWNITVDENTKLDINKIKDSPDIITEIEWELDCVWSKVNYQETIQSWSKSEAQVLDVTIDLTRIGKWEDFEKMTTSRVDQVKSLIEGELYDW